MGVVERRDIEIFLTLAEELHFGRTAERLGVSAARVSQTIARLERRFGVTLFDRTSRRVALTPLGSTLHEDVRAGYQRIQEGIATITAAGRGYTGVLRVGFSSPLVGEVIMAVSDAFRARYPGCEVQIREIHLSDAFGALRSGEIDVQFSEFPVREPDLTTGPVLLSDRRLLAVSARHPFARRRTVTLEDLTRDTVLAPAGAPDYLLDALIPPRAPSGRAVRRDTSVTSRQETLTLVAAGKAMAVVGAQATRYHTRPDIAYRPIEDVPPIEYGPVWRTSGETSRMRSFLALTREHVTARE